MSRGNYFSNSPNFANASQSNKPFVFFYGHQAKRLNPFSSDIFCSLCNCLFNQCLIVVKKASCFQTGIMEDEGGQVNREDQEAVDHAAVGDIDDHHAQQQGIH